MTWPSIQSCADTRLQDAIDALNSLQSGFKVIEQRLANRVAGTAVHKNAVPQMIEWLKRIGYQVSLYHSEFRLG